MLVVEERLIPVSEGLYFSHIEWKGRGLRDAVVQWKHSLESHSQVNSIPEVSWEGCLPPRHPCARWTGRYQHFQHVRFCQYGECNCPWSEGSRSWWRRRHLWDEEGRVQHTLEIDTSANVIFSIILLYIIREWNWIREQFGCSWHWVPLHPAQALRRHCLHSCQRHHYHCH